MGKNKWKWEPRQRQKQIEHFLMFFYVFASNNPLQTDTALPNVLNPSCCKTKMSTVLKYKIELNQIKHTFWTKKAHGI